MGGLLCVPTSVVPCLSCWLGLSLRHLARVQAMLFVVGKHFLSSSPCPTMMTFLALADHLMCHISEPAGSLVGGSYCEAAQNPSGKAPPHTQHNHQFPTLSYQELPFRGDGVQFLFGRKTKQIVLIPVWSSDSLHRSFSDPTPYLHFTWSVF